MRQPWKLDQGDTCTFPFWAPAIGIYRGAIIKNPVRVAGGGKEPAPGEGARGSEARQRRQAQGRAPPGLQRPSDAIRRSHLPPAPRGPSGRSPATSCSTDDVTPSLSPLQPAAPRGPGDPVPSLGTPSHPWGRCLVGQGRARPRGQQVSVFAPCLRGMGVLRCGAGSWQGTGAAGGREHLQQRLLLSPSHGTAPGAASPSPAAAAGAFTPAPRAAAGGTAVGGAGAKRSARSHTSHGEGEGCREDASLHRQLPLSAGTGASAASGTACTAPAAARVSADPGSGRGAPASPSSPWPWPEGGGGRRRRPHAQLLGRGSGDGAQGMSRDGALGRCGTVLRAVRDTQGQGCSPSPATHRGACA